MHKCVCDDMVDCCSYFFVTLVGFLWWKSYHFDILDLKNLSFFTVFVIKKIKVKDTGNMMHLICFYDAIQVGL